jgi:CheY-like chemotaxis protein
MRTIGGLVTALGTSNSGMLLGGPRSSMGSTTCDEGHLTETNKPSWDKQMGETKPSCGTLERCLPLNSLHNLTGMTSKPKIDYTGIRYESTRVLVAEDNAINRKVLGRMLDRLGVVNVDMVENGLLAVEREASKEYDLVLMDMQMPVMDGVEACRLIVNRHGGHSSPIVVFVTAHAGLDYGLQCEKAGGRGFLSKPFNFDDIQKCFSRVCGIQPDAAILSKRGAAINLPSPRAA